MSGEIKQKLDRYFLPREQLAENQKADGKFYRTYRAWLKEEFWPDGQPSYVIIKEIPESMFTIYDKLSHVCHPNLEAVYGVLSDNERCYTINEYVTPPICMSRLQSPHNCCQSLSLESFLHDFHGSFNNSVLSFDDRTHLAFVILLQLCEALEAIHAKGMIHGDIHPGNILLTDAPDWYKLAQTVDADFCVKLIDFDNTQIPKESDHTVTHLMGTKPFSAPEILDFSHPLDRADIYSLGCILYYTIYGKSPKERTPEKISDKWLNRIFRRCTASYEARYHNITALKKDLLRALRIPSNPVSRVVHKLPGFRSHSLWKMGVALYMYIALALTAGYTLISILQTGLPLQNWQKDNLLTTLFLILEILLVFDMFHLEERSKYYTYLKHAHPSIKYLVRITAALLVFFVYILLLSGGI